MAIDIGLLIACMTAALSALGWYASQVRSAYSRERQYAQIISYLKEASQYHKDNSKELDTVADRLSRLEILILREGKSHV